MLLFDLIDALERKERDGTAAGSPAGTMPPALPLPFPPTAAAIMPMPVPPTGPWLPGTHPPFGGPPAPWPGMPAPNGRLPTLIDLLYRNGPPMLPRPGTLPWPAIPMSAATPAVDEGSRPVGASDRTVDGAEESPAEAPTTGDKPIGSEGPPQLAQAPKPRPDAVSTQQQSPSAPAAGWKNKAVGARLNGPDEVEIDRDDATVEIRRGGTKSWRYNNPTNLRYDFEEIARQNGAIATDKKGFAIFPSEEVGKRAALANLRGPKYRNVTLDKAVENWAPKHENDTAAYQRFVQAQTGMPGDTKIGSLTPQQRRGSIKR